jgi:hypothetical protein
MTGCVSRNVLDVELANGKHKSMKISINVSRHIKTYVDRPLDSKQWQEKIKLMAAWNKDVQAFAASNPRGIPGWLSPFVPTPRQHNVSWRRGN